MKIKLQGMQKLDTHLMSDHGIEVLIDMLKKELVQRREKRKQRSLL